MAQTVGERDSREGPNGLLTVARPAGHWLLFFLICLGLGYPALNRYDPANANGTADAAVYRDMVVNGVTADVAQSPDALTRLGSAENYYRLLVPSVARPFYLLLNGRTGSWDAALFALLIANSIFTAATVSMLVAASRQVGLSHPAAMLAATLYLLNFAVANLSLAGLIDSGEACFMMATVWSLLAGRWYLLPLCGVMGALAKETFAPLATLFVFGWWIASEREGRRRLSRIAWICALALSSVLTVTITMSTLAHGWVWPWEFAGAMHEPGGFLTGLKGCLLDHTFWYVFVWLLPLGIVRLRHLPRPWIVASGLAFFAALALGAYNNAAGNTTRALFNVAGPLLSLSAATFIGGPDSAIEPNLSAGADGLPHS